MASLSDLLPALKGSFGGAVVAPGDTRYDAVRQLAMGGTDPRPGAVLRPRTAADVAAAVNFARDHGLSLAVRSGGHSGAAHSTNNPDGVVIDLRDMKALQIDEAGATAWAETGLTAGEVSAAVTAKGLAVGFGDAATVGIGGITTGGGVGYLSRKYGLTVDSVLAAEIVTADGKAQVVDAAHNPDLFWAVRGGGGNFGIVTRFKFGLAQMPAFTGGILCLPATPQTVDSFLAAADMAPEELSTIANAMPAPPMPFLPAEWHGKPIILGMLAFAGDEAAAQMALRPFRAIATPLADMVKPGPYMQMFPPEDPDYKPMAVGKNLYFDRLDAGIGKTVLDQLAKTDGMRVVQIRVLGGAIARVAADATAYAHRTLPAMAQIAAFHDGSAAGKAAKQAWIADTYAALPVHEGAAYVNFLGDEGEARVRDAYPVATWDRLRRIKQAVDPQNLFRRNQNIPPAG